MKTEAFAVRGLPGAGEKVQETALVLHPFTPRPPFIFTPNINFHLLKGTVEYRVGTSGGGAWGLLGIVVF